MVEIEDVEGKVWLVNQDHVVTVEPSGDREFSVIGMSSGKEIRTYDHLVWDIHKLEQVE